MLLESSKHKDLSKDKFSEYQSKIESLKKQPRTPENIEEFKKIEGELQVI